MIDIEQDLIRQFLAEEMQSCASACGLNPGGLIDNAVIGRANVVLKNRLAELAFYDINLTFDKDKGAVSLTDGIALTDAGRQKFRSWNVERLAPQVPKKRYITSID